MKQLQFTIILTAAIGTLFSTSCATTRGFGQDLQKVGNKLENEADASGGAAPVQTAPSQSAPAAY